MLDDPVLLIVARLPPAFRLDDLEIGDAGSRNYDINPSKYKGLEKVEAIIDGMAFILTMFTAEETQRGFEAERQESIFASPPDPEYSSIGITLGENIKHAKHVSAVNRALLKLAGTIGFTLDAVSIVWRPANLNIGFDYFTETAEQYIVGGPFPVLAQIAIFRGESGVFETDGLSYFSGQEIHLIAPETLKPNEVVKRLVRIVHDIATNGKISNILQSDGFAVGEKITFEPETDAKILKVTVAH